MQDEKIYKTMSSVGIWSMVLGIVAILVGALTGAALILTRRAPKLSSAIQRMTLPTRQR